MLTLPAVKYHCRIDSDFTADDDLLGIYINAARRYVETWTRRTMYDKDTDPGFEDDPDALLCHENVDVAMLLLVGHWYANREAVNTGTTSALPFAVEALLQPYRIYGV